MGEGQETDGLVTLRSRYGVDETLRRLLELLELKGIKVFATIDHSGEAERAGLRMPQTKLVIFGSPAAGTPVMLAAPTAAIDLPMKLLIREAGEGGGGSLVTYNTPEFLEQRHGITAELGAVLRGTEAIAQALTM